MTALMIILLSAAVAFGISTWLRVPAIPLLVLAGIGLNGLAYVADVPLERGTIEEMMQLGLTFLVFAAGMELNPARIGRQRKAAITVGTAQFATMAVIGAGLALLLGFQGLEAVYVAFAIAASSTIVVVRILMQRRQFFEPFGRLVLGVLLLQDLLIILLLAILSGAEDPHERGVAMSIALAMSATVAMMALAYVFIRWVSPWLLLREHLDQETMLLSAVAVLFLFVGVAYWTSLPLPVGAFLAGVALAAFPVNGVIRAPVMGLSNFFLALFFVTLGATITFPGIRELFLAIALSVTIIALTPPLVVLLARRTGISTRSAIESGLLLAQCSEFSIVLVLIGSASGHVREEMVSMFVLLTVMTMIMTSFIATDQVTLRLLRFHPSARDERMVKSLKNHIILIGCGSNSRVLLDLLLLEGHDVVVVDEDPAVVDSLRSRGITAVKGDGGDPALLEKICARDALVIASTMRRLLDNLRLLRHVRHADVPVLVRVFDDEEAERFRRLGGETILESEAAADEFVKWFAERQERSREQTTRQREGTA